MLGGKYGLNKEKNMLKNHPSIINYQISYLMNDWNKTIKLVILMYTACVCENFEIYFYI